MYDDFRLSGGSGSLVDYIFNDEGGNPIRKSNYVFGDWTMQSRPNL